MDENTLQSMKLPVDSAWLPEAAASFTSSVDDTWWLIFWTCVVAFVVVMGPLFWFMWKYRRRHEGQKALSQADHNQVLEIAWSAIPTVFFVLIFFWGFKGYMNLQIAPADALEIRVTGQKWQWTWRYPNGVTVTGRGAEFAVPADRPVRLVLTSTDVIHSFFVPNFRAKMDAIPWRYTTLWFQAQPPEWDADPGPDYKLKDAQELRALVEKNGYPTYPVFCTEYCGKDHSNMLAKIKVMPADAFEAWLDKKAEESLGPASVAAGQKVYNAICVACHSLDGTRRVGPSLKGIFGRKATLQDGSTVTADEQYLLESILEPNKKVVQGYPPVMPPMGGTLNQTQIDSLILFLKTQTD